MSALHPANDIVDRGIALHKVREVTCCRLHFADSKEVKGFLSSLSCLKFDRINQPYFSDLVSPFLFALYVLFLTQRARVYFPSFAMSPI